MMIGLLQSSSSPPVMSMLCSEKIKLNGIELNQHQGSETAKVLGNALRLLLNYGLLRSIDINFKRGREEMEINERK